MAIYLQQIFLRVNMNPFFLLELSVTHEFVLLGYMNKRCFCVKILLGKFLVRLYANEQISYRCAESEGAVIDLNN